jgi:hypothetical protein
MHLCAYFFENFSVYEIMWEKYVRDGHATDVNKTRRMRFACWIPKATNIL